MDVTHKLFTLEQKKALLSLATASNFFSTILRVFVRNRLQRTISNWTKTSTLTILVCAWTFGVTQPLSRDETKVFLGRLGALKLRSSAVHLIEERAEGSGKKTYISEVWYSPGELHVRVRSNSVDTYYDRLGTYELDPAGKRLDVRKPGNGFLYSPFDTMLGPEIHQIADAKLSWTGTNYLIQGQLRPSREAGQFPTRVQVSVWLTPDLLPVRFEETSYLEPQAPTPRTQVASLPLPNVKAQSPLTGETTTTVIVGYASADGIRYPSKSIEYFQGRKIYTNQVRFASFRQLQSQELVPNLLARGLVIHDYRKSIPVIWTQAAILKANKGLRHLDTQELLALTNSATAALNGKERQRYTTWRSNLAQRDRAERNSFHVSMETILIIGGLVLAVAFVFSAYRTLTTRRRWGG